MASALSVILAALLDGGMTLERLRPGETGLFSPIVVGGLAFALLVLLFELIGSLKEKRAMHARLEEVFR